MNSYRKRDRLFTYIVELKRNVRYIYTFSMR